MIYEEIGAFANACAPMTALSGLDFGTKTIGVAVSDRMRGVASPLETIRRKKFGVDAAALLGLLAARDIGGIIIGLPRNMDGTEGPRCQSTRAFAQNLSRLTELPITFWDERLSTVAAERALLEADTTRKRRAEVIDHVAAGYILQGALDRLRHLQNERPITRMNAPVTPPVWKRKEIDSPCVQICVVHPVERICTGCYRTIDEISRWSKMSDGERSEIMAALPGRAPKLQKRRGGRAARMADRT